MSHRSRNARHDLALLSESSRLKRVAQGRNTHGDSLMDFEEEFDADAWSILIDEQRLRIARAAGVDPSKVRIQIGH